MKKLRLDPDALSVEPFEVQSAQEERGTVLGNDLTHNQVSCQPLTGSPVCRTCL